MALDQVLSVADAVSRGVLVFAKVPVLGTVKTRMHSALSAEETLALHRHLLDHSLGTLRQANIAQVELWLSEQPLEQFGYGVNTFIQQGRDLGERLSHALASALQRYQSVVIIGSDCPFIDAGYLGEAFHTLSEGYQAVLGPADDGGYVLLGSRQHDARLFEQIEWGSSRVLEQTQSQLKSLRWRWKELGSLSDIDRPEDLPLLKEIPSLAGWADR